MCETREFCVFVLMGEVVDLNEFVGRVRLKHFVSFFLFSVQNERQFGQFDRFYFAHGNNRSKFVITRYFEPGLVTTSS